MTTVLTKATVLTYPAVACERRRACLAVATERRRVLNRNWKAINVRTPRRALRPDEGSLDHVVPRSRGGKEAWDNPVWSSKDVNSRKSLPREVGLKLLSVPRPPKGIAGIGNDLQFARDSAMETVCAGMNQRESGLKTTLSWNSTA